jgi:hypothetical protein
LASFWRPLKFGSNAIDNNTARTAITINSSMSVKPEVLFMGPLYKVI